MASNGRLRTSDLTPISAKFHTHGTTAYLRADAADSFLRVAHAFERRFGKRLVAMSFYRPMSDQVRIFLKNYYRYSGRRRAGTTDRSYRGSTYRRRSGMSPVASPGYSNHGLGTTVDFNSGVQVRGSAEHQWMHSVATQHGWDWSAGRRVNEPWHWEYVPSKDRKRGAPKASGSGSAPSSQKSTVADLAESQRKLLRLGYKPGPLDGKLGPSTRSAAKIFQRDVGLKVDGIPGPSTRKALDSMATIAENIETILFHTKYIDTKPSHVERRLKAELPALIWDHRIGLKGPEFEGKTSTPGTKVAWLDHERETGEKNIVAEVRQLQLDQDEINDKLDKVLALLASDSA